MLASRESVDWIDARPAQCSESCTAGSILPQYPIAAPALRRSAAFGQWAFGIGQPHRDRRGRTGIVKGRSAQSDAIAWTMLSWSASGISAICFVLTRLTTIRLGRTCRSTRMRHHRALFMPLAPLCRRRSSADFAFCMCEFDFRQARCVPAGE